MVNKRTSHVPTRIALLRWVAGLGAVTAEALAQHDGRSVGSARGQLLAAERAGCLRRARPLAGRPTLFAVTRSGLREAGIDGLEPCRVSGANAEHAIVCAEVAAALEHAYPDHHVMGERELRRDERAAGIELASARIGVAREGAPLLHRPDLVLWPQSPQRAPVAVEVELTVKAPRRLLEICRAWARCRCVAGALYLTAADVSRPLTRAIDGAQAGERVVQVPLEALLASDASAMAST
jgi:hypothetical protein